MISTVEVKKSAFTGLHTMNGDDGFSYPAALLMVVVVSISLMAAQRQWSTVMKREREKQLFFRAGQIEKAIGSYYNYASGGSAEYPKKLWYLLKDNRKSGVKRHLRKLYKDPMTMEGYWGIIYDGKGGIKGVFSKSHEKPIKSGGFPVKYKLFENKQKYSDWKFVYEKKQEKKS
jgi:type II secretory pathway pseudopilin PulG